MWKSLVRKCVDKQAVAVYNVLNNIQMRLKGEVITHPSSKRGTVR